MRSEQLVNFRVAGWKSDAVHRRSRTEQRLNRLRRAPISPVRVHTRTYGESQWGTSLAVRRVDGRSAFDEELHSRVACTPGRDMQCRAVLCDIPIAVASLKQRTDADAKIEKVPNAVRVPV